MVNNLLKEIFIFKVIVSCSEKVKENTLLQAKELAKKIGLEFIIDPYFKNNTKDIESSQLKELNKKRKQFINDLLNKEIRFILYVKEKDNYTILKLKDLSNL